MALIVLPLHTVSCQLEGQEILYQSEGFFNSLVFFLKLFSFFNSLVSLNS